MGFGKPKHGSNYKKIKQLGDKDGLSWKVRILPPMHSLEAKGQFCVGHRQHFGYAVPSKGEAGKSMPRPFYCVEKMDFRTKTILESCPECDSIKEQKDRLASAKETLKKKGLTEDKIGETVKPITSWLAKHNLDKKFYYNVKFVDGSFSTIKIPWSMKQKLDKMIKDLTHPEDASKESLDPIDAESGVWFEFSRSGKGFLNTEYDVKIVTETLRVEVPGRGVIPVEEIKRAPLTEEDYGKALEACYDLSDVGIPHLSADRISVLVKGNGEPEEVEAVFGIPERAESSPEASPATTKTTPASKPVQAAATMSAPVSTPVEEVEEPIQQMAVKEPDQSQTNISDPNDWDEETFARLFGKKN